MPYMLFVATVADAELPNCAAEHIITLHVDNTVQTDFTVRLLTYAWEIIF